MCGQKQNTLYQKKAERSSNFPQNINMSAWNFGKKYFFSMMRQR